MDGTLFVIDTMFPRSQHPRNTQVLRTSPSGFGNGAASTAGVLGAPNTEAHIVDAFEPPPSRLSALPARCHQDW